MIEVAQKVFESRILSGQVFDVRLKIEELRLNIVQLQLHFFNSLGFFHQSLLEFCNGALDDVAALMQLLVRHNQRRSKADDVAMCGLC